jgi:hypothetical protein
LQSPRIGILTNILISLKLNKNNVQEMTTI